MFLLVVWLLGQPLIAGQFEYPADCLVATETVMAANREIWRAACVVKADERIIYEMRRS